MPKTKTRKKTETQHVSITLDNRPLKVPRGLTILQAAQRHDVYIPTLCAHTELTPFGGCRLCIVEVEGMRGFPTACTTPVEDGMVIRTRTAGVQAERREILQLILSEHTSSCLICDERHDCRENMTTIRKAGVTTGCRYCPNDEQCELQDVVDYLELEEINYPISYRHLPVEKNDPFYDRDYNLCILCGRCIRMCQEIRTANVLAFKQRGRQTVIGPAFQRTHLEAGCEFCGACVSVCPTGALAERARKWDGVPQKEVITTCALCGLGCQVRLQIKDNRVMGTLPADDSVVNRGQLCVKGRFCVSGLVGGHRRLRRPYRMEGGTRVELSWKEALDLVARRLDKCPSDRFAMIVSPACTNEDLYMAGKFTRLAMGSDRIDTSARLTYGPTFDVYLSLFRRSVPLSCLETAETILTVGLDTRYGRSVVGVQIRRAMSRGARLATIHPREHNLSRIADLWLQPEPGGELELLRSLGRRMTGKAAGRIGAQGTARKGPHLGGGSDLSSLTDLLSTSQEIVILVGPELLWHDDGAAILRQIDRLAETLEAGIMPLPAEGNLIGSVLMGAYPELLPGGRSRRDKKSVLELEKRWQAKLPGSRTRWNMSRMRPDRRLKVLYLVGRMLPQPHELADFVIFQSIYPPDDPESADVVLPAAAFTETEGTFFNGEGRLQRMHMAVESPGRALPDYDILCRLARTMGRQEFDVRGIRQLQKEMSRCVPGGLDYTRPDRRPASLAVEASMRTNSSRNGSGLRGRLPFILFASADEHLYREIPLARHLDDAAVIFAPERVFIHPQDARRIGIREGDRVVVFRGRWQRIWPVRITAQQPAGTLHVVLPAEEMVQPNPVRVRLKKYSD
jgi:predicted molibdopterin-dependent oxidoreductase YjgC